MISYKNRIFYKKYTGISCWQLPSSELYWPRPRYRPQPISHSCANHKKFKRKKTELEREGKEGEDESERAEITRRRGSNNTTKGSEIGSFFLHPTAPAGGRQQRLTIGINFETLQKQTT